MGGGAKKGLKEATNNIDDGIKKVGKEVKEKTTKKVDNILNSIIEKQKSIIENVKSGNIDLNQGNSNFRKGNFGEICTDIDLIHKGYNPLHIERVTDIDSPMKKGIDGVFEKNGDFFIVESKYSGTSKLKDTKDGPQMSDSWINGSNRLRNAVGEEMAAIIDIKKYRRILSEVSPNGNIIYKELDLNGKVLKQINL